MNPPSHVRRPSGGERNVFSRSLPVRYVPSYGAQQSVSLRTLHGEGRSSHPHTSFTVRVWVDVHVGETFCRTSKNIFSSFVDGKLGR